MHNRERGQGGMGAVEPTRLCAATMIVCSNSTKYITMCIIDSSIVNSNSYLIAMPGFGVGIFLPRDKSETTSYIDFDYLVLG